MEEIWKDVVGYEGSYIVSNSGRIKRNPNGKNFKGNYGDIFQTVTHHGYKRTILTKNNIRTNFFVHIIVSRAFIGEPIYGYQVNHINSIRHDNRIENLEYVTPKYNTQLSRSGKIRGYRKEKWGFAVYIWEEKRNIYLGTFKEESEAQGIYKKKYFEINGFYPY